MATKTSNKKDIGETICEAVSVIIDKRIEELAFDRTVICTITNDNAKDYGHYIVDNNGTSFDAYCDRNKVYHKGEQVFVLIPQGDFSASQKTILSKYNVSDNNEVKFYSSPFKSLILMTDDLVQEKDEEQGLNVNAGLNPVPIFEGEIPGDLNSQNFTSIGIKASFKSLLSDYIITRGEYGLAINLSGISTDGLNDKKSKVIYFSSREMFGNPFGYISFSAQEKKIDITDLDFIIKKIQISFYQTNNFQAYGQDIEPAAKKEIKDLYVKNVEFYFANDMAVKEKNSIEIYCNNKKYDINNFTRDIMITWYQIDKDGNYIGFPENEEEHKYSIKWLYLSQGAWISATAKEKENHGKEKIYTLTLRGKAKEEKIKAILVRENEKDISSNILSFNNTDFPEESLEAAKVADLSISLGDKAEASYPLYGSDNGLLNSSQSTINRQLKLAFSPINVNLTAEQFFKEATSISWILPKGNNTMLSYDKDFLSKNFELEDQASSIVFKWKQHDPPSDKNVNYPDPFAFLIKKTYNSAATQNIVKCLVVYKGIEYVAKISFLFSASGNNGNNYTLAIGQDKNRMTAALYDADSQLIDSSKVTFQWFEIIEDSIKSKLSNTSSDSIIYQWNSNKPNIIGVTATFGNIEVTQLQAVDKQNYSDKVVYYATTPTKVVYDKAGANPSYYKGELKLYDSNNEQVKVNGGGLKLSWSLNYFQSTETSASMDSIPKIIKDGDQYTFLASPVYTDKQTPVTLIASFGEIIVWEQPIVILKQAEMGTANTKDKEGLVIKSTKDVITDISLGKVSYSDDSLLSGIVAGIKQSNDNSKKAFGIYAYEKDNQYFTLEDSGNFIIGPNAEIVKEADHISVGPLSVFKSNLFAGNKRNSKYFAVSQDGTLEAMNPIFYNLHIDGEIEFKNPNEDAYSYRMRPVKIPKLSISEGMNVTIPCQVNGQAFVDADGNGVTVTIPTYVINESGYYGTFIGEEGVK